VDKAKARNIRNIDGIAVSVLQLAPAGIIKGKHHPSFPPALRSPNSRTSAAADSIYGFTA
jgi:hypothetical protein